MNLPVTILIGLITLWAQLNHHGIDAEKYTHLKDVRLTEEIDNQLHAQQNKIHNMKTDFKDSVIMKNIFNGIEGNRVKKMVASYFIETLRCPEFKHRVIIEGKTICAPDDYDYIYNDN